MMSILFALCLVGYVSCMPRTIWSSNLKETPISLDKYIDSQDTPNSRATARANPDTVLRNSGPGVPVRPSRYPQFPIRHAPRSSQHLTRILPPWIFREPQAKSLISVPDFMDQMSFFKGHVPGLHIPPARTGGISLDTLALLSEYTRDMKKQNLDKSFFH